MTKSSSESTHTAACERNFTPRSLRLPEYMPTPPPSSTQIELLPPPSAAQIFYYWDLGVSREINIDTHIRAHICTHDEGGGEKNTGKNPAERLDAPSRRNGYTSIVAFTRQTMLEVRQFTGQLWGP